MLYTFAFIALSLLFAAWKSRKDRATVIFLLCGVALNIGGIYKAVSKNDPYAYKLRPNDGEYDPPYRR